MKLIHRLYSSMLNKVQGNPKTVDISPRARVKNSSFEGMSKVGSGTCLQDVSVGYGTYFGANTTVDNAEFGRYCSIGSNVSFISGKHPTSLFVSTSPCFFSLQKQNGMTYVKKQEFEEYSYIDGSHKWMIGNDVWIANNVLVVEGVRIADGAIIGAGALVTKDIPPYAIAVGVPARVIKYRFTFDQIDALLKIKWWDKGLDWLAEHSKYFINIEEFLIEVKAE